MILNKIDPNSFEFAQLDEQDRVDIDKFINDIQLLQHPDLYLENQQAGFVDSLKALNENLDLKQEYSIVMPCNLQQLENVLSMDGMLQDQRMILVYGLSHATALFCKKDQEQQIKLYHFDANNFPISGVTGFDNTKELATSIFASHKATFLYQDQNILQQITKLSRESSSQLAFELAKKYQAEQQQKNIHVVTLKIFSFAAKPEFNYPDQERVMSEMQKTIDVLDDKDKKMCITQAIGDAIQTSSYESLEFLLKHYGRFLEARYVDFVAAVGDVKSLNIVLTHLQEKKRFSDMDQCTAKAFIGACEKNRINVANFILDFLQDKEKGHKSIVTFMSHLGKGISGDGCISSFNYVINNLLNYGHFDIIDKLLMLGLKHDKDELLGCTCRNNPNWFKYLMHFNFYCSHNVTALIEKYALPDFLNDLKKINFLQTLDKKTRYFLLKYIQSFGDEMFSSWDEDVKIKITKLNEHIISGDKENILLDLAHDFGVKEKLITNTTIDEFFREVETVRETGQKPLWLEQHKPLLDQNQPQEIKTQLDIPKLQPDDEAFM